MATIDNLFDSGRGRLGNLVVYKLNGVGVVRTRPGHYRDRRSPAQLEQRQRLQAVNGLLNPFSGLLKITFPPEKAGRTARAEAQSYTMRNALAGTYPDIFVDKSKALLSRGPLPLPVSATVTVQPEGLLIEWINGAEAAGSRAHDTLVVMALQAESQQAGYRFTAARRSEGRYLWTPALPKGTVDVWLAFRNPGQTVMSDSFWAGEQAV